MVLEWLVPYGELLCFCEGIFLTETGSSFVALALCLACKTLVWLSGHPSGCVGMSVPVPAVSDSICRHDESSLTSAGEPSESSMSSDDWL